MNTPLTVLTVTCDGRMLILYRYINNEVRLFKYKMLTDVVLKMASNSQTNEIGVCQTSKVSVFDINLNVKYSIDFKSVISNFNPIIANVVYVGEDLYALSGSSIFRINGSKSNTINVPYGKVLYIKGHKRHLIVAEDKKMYVVDVRSGKIALMFKVKSDGLLFY